MSSSCPVFEKKACLATASTPLFFNNEKISGNICISNITQFISHTNTRHLSHCSRFIRKECLEKRLIHLKLNVYASGSFHSDYRDFRSKIQTGIVIESLNLDLDIYTYCIDEVVKGVPNVVIGECFRLVDVSNLAMSKRVHISNGNKITDVNCLRNLESLTLYECDNIIDVSALGNIKRLTIIRGSIEDVSGLGNNEYLNLKGCVLISDVSSLGNVHTLSLSNCLQISDVSALGNVHTLNLSHCNRISDVSALGNVHTLILEHCYRIRDLSALINVHTLNLNNCWNVSNVNVLVNVQVLHLRNCSMVKDVSSLVNLKFIDLNMTGVEDLSTLTETEKVCIDDVKYQKLMNANDPIIKQMKGLRVDQTTLHPFYRRFM